MSLSGLSNETSFAQNEFSNAAANVTTASIVFPSSIHIFMDNQQDVRWLSLANNVTTTLTRMDLSKLILLTTAVTNANNGVVILPDPQLCVGGSIEFVVAASANSDIDENTGDTLNTFVIRTSVGCLSGGVLCGDANGWMLFPSASSNATNLTLAGLSEDVGCVVLFYSNGQNWVVSGQIQTLVGGDCAFS